MLRLQPDDLELLDLWIAANDGAMSRPEALRRILRLVAMRVSNPVKADDSWMASFDNVNESSTSGDEPV